MSLNQLLTDQPRPQIAGSATLLGDVHVGAGAILAQGLVVRSHGGAVSVGNYSAVLENGVVIGTPEHPVRVGQRTVFGHRATIVGADHRGLVRDRQRRNPHARLPTRQRVHPGRGHAGSAGLCDPDRLGPGRAPAACDPVGHGRRPGAARGAASAPDRPDRLPRH